MQAHTVVKYMNDHTQIIVKDDHYVSREECDEIYKKIKNIIKNSSFDKEKK